MRGACYSILHVQEVHRGVGVVMRDTCRESEFLLTDLGFSQTAAPGRMLASRYIRVDGITMTTGAPLPILEETCRELLLRADRLQRAEHLPGSRGSREAKAEFSAMVIRACLKTGASAHMLHQNAASPRQRGVHSPFVSQPRLQAPPLPAPMALSSRPLVPAGRHPPGRNKPCPCGSGRKYKKCCGRD
jgi:hypothetical protein